MVFCGVLAVLPLLAQTTVPTVLKQSCTPCHNDRTSSGGLNINQFLDTATIRTSRDGWERIADKIRRHEMPPKGFPALPQATIDSVLHSIEAEFDKADRAALPYPGRITARRLNRAEYTNTVRDLLGVEFSAKEEFPADDSGYGFDNISDVLTVSPTLLQKYLRAGEKIAMRAVGADPLPKPGLFNKKNRTRRLGPNAIEVVDQVDYDADYNLRALINGHRGNNGKPVLLRISVDGKVVKEAMVDSAWTLVSRQGGATQRTQEDVLVFVPQGVHTFKAEFEFDDLYAKVTPEMWTNVNRNIFPETFEIGGPYPSKEMPPARKRLLVCDPASGEACVGRILTPLVRRAYRRPALPVEVQKLVSIHKRALEAGYSPGQSLQFAIAAMLVSPQFLFRIENEPKPGSYSRISDLELASRLSYFLWSSMPDDELLGLAQGGKLRQPAVLDAQVKRMLASPKSIALAENFASQWLETRSLDAVKPDPEKFRAWNSDLRDAMATETKLFFDHILRENRSITEFINGKYTFLNEQLARHYGIEDVKGPDFRRVELTTDQRGGVLTHGSVLTVSSYPSRTSVVLRGKYLLENVFGSPPPAAPPDVPALDESATGNTKSLRQQMEAHRTNPVCASCHTRMDPLGFGLENYDAIGRWRTQDGKFPVDASGTFLDGKSFKTPAEMKELLTANIFDFSRNLTEKIFIYALGRGPETPDRGVIREIVRANAADGYKLQSIVYGVVHSLPFQAKSGEKKK